MEESLDGSKEGRFRGMSRFRLTASFRSFSSRKWTPELMEMQRSVMPSFVRALNTTWNMGGVGRSELEAGLPAVLPKWIPEGYDLYVSEIKGLLMARSFTRRLLADSGRSGLRMW